MLTRYASSSDLLVSCLQRLEQRFLIPPQPFQSMTSDSCGHQLPESRHLAQDSVEGLAEAELADLDAQPADQDEDVATDSIDEDYQPIPRYRSPRPHDHEAGGSGSASRSDPVMVAILERLTQAQERQEV
jgi:hypothetical protein